MSEEIVELRDVSKRYGREIMALNGVTLSIPRGVIFGLLGPNGSGKTTMLKIIVGILRDFSGSASVAGFPLPSRMTAGLIGYMPQTYALYEDLSVFENLDFFAAVNGLRGRRKRIRELVGILELADKIDSPIHALSGGMKQRVSLGCAMVHEPELLLLDEPTVGLDPRLRREFWGHFRELADRGKTIILSTHSFDEARYCDTLGFLRQGIVTAVGGIGEILSQAGTTDLEEAYIRFVPREGGDR